MNFYIQNSKPEMKWSHHHTKTNQIIANTLPLVRGGGVGGGGGPKILRNATACTVQLKPLQDNMDT